MAFQINNKVDCSSALRAIGTLQTLHTLLAADARYQIIASYNLGVAEGWFVFKMVGHPWQVWLGAAASTYTQWSTVNSDAGSFSSYNISYAFSPSGGWRVGTDTPNTAGLMFSDAVLAGWWCKIRSISFSVATSGQFTLISDNTLGAVILAYDGDKDNTWAGVWCVTPVESRFSELDEYPYICLAGTPQLTPNNASAWFSTIEAIYSSILLPGNTLGGKTSCDGYASNLTAAYGQPNPMTGKYDLVPIPITCATPGVQHSRGLVHPSVVRQCMSTLAIRTVLGTNPGAWMVIGPGVCVPWDTSLVP